MALRVITSDKNGGQQLACFYIKVVKLNEAKSLSSIFFQRKLLKRVIFKHRIYDVFKGETSKLFFFWHFFRQGRNQIMRPSAKRKRLRSVKSKMY